MSLPSLSSSQMSQGRQQHACTDAWNLSTCDGCQSPVPSTEKAGAVLLAAGGNGGSSARTRVVGRLRRSVPQAKTHWGHGSLDDTLSRDLLGTGQIGWDRRKFLSHIFISEDLR